MKENKWELRIFIIVSLISGWIGVFVNQIVPSQGEESLGLLIWLILPCLLSLLLRLIHRDWENMGLKPRFSGNGLIYLMAFLIYPMMTIFSIGAAYGTGNLKILDLHFGNVIPAMVTLIFSGLFKNIIEEFAWRGYMTPKLMYWIKNDWALYLSTGLVWALWHLPYYLVLLSSRNFMEIDRLPYTILATLTILLWSPMFTEFYRISKSIWPGVLIRTVGHGIILSLFMTGTFLAIESGAIIWLHPLIGLLPNIIILLIGLALRKYRINCESGGKVGTGI